MGLLIEAGQGVQALDDWPFEPTFASMTSLQNRWIWWLAALIGAILPLSQFLPWALEDAENIGLFLRESTTTPAARAVLADILWAAAVFSVFVVVQAWRTKSWKLLFAILATWTLGLSCGLPLYFALRD